MFKYGFLFRKFSPGIISSRNIFVCLGGFQLNSRGRRRLEHIASDVRRASPEMSEEKVAALPLTERIRYHATMVCTPHTLPTFTYRI